MEMETELHFQILRSNNKILFFWKYLRDLESRSWINWITLAHQKSLLARDKVILMRTIILFLWKISIKWTFICRNPVEDIGVGHFVRLFIFMKPTRFITFFTRIQTRGNHTLRDRRLSRHSEDYTPEAIWQWGDKGWSYVWGHWRW